MRSRNTKNVWAFVAAAAATGGAVKLTACGGDGDAPAGIGAIEIALEAAPADAGCLRVIVGGNKPVVRSVDLTPGASARVNVSGLPYGAVDISGEAFASACDKIPAGALPSWVSEAPAKIEIKAGEVAKALLKLIANGRLSVGVDFADGPTGPYVVGVAPGVVTKDILTVGDAAGTKPDGTPYRMVGIPDGLGAFDNNDGTFTLLSNQELGNTAGIARAHGGKGAFVSKWTIRKSDLKVLAGEDLIKQVATWNPVTAAYNAPATGIAFARFCSADLPPVSAFYDAASKLGTEKRFFMNGEENGVDGRAFAHGLDGVSHELPWLGKQSWENIVANGGSGAKTIVAGLDDSTPGQVLVYVGTKTAAGTDIEKAGLTNGKLYGVKVTGFPAEDAATGIPAGSDFTLVEIPNAAASTGAQIETVMNTAGVTQFNRPEDAAWNPTRANELYFVTTASFAGQSRLWRLRWNDLSNPEAGGKIEALTDSSEGPRMMDNMTIDKSGRFVYLQEDVGNNAHIGKIYRYDIAADSLTLLAQHNPTLFAPGAPKLLTNDEEASGIIDVSEILGEGYFLFDVQAHYDRKDAELVEGGQFVLMFDPAAKTPVP